MKYEPKIPLAIAESPELMARRIAREEDAMDSLLGAVDNLVRAMSVLVANLDDAGIETPTSVDGFITDAATEMDDYKLTVTMAREYGGKR
jgi:hypothetical protein